MVRAGQGAVEGEMLLDDASTESRGGDIGGNPLRVVAETYAGASERAQGLHSAQIHGLHRRGILRGAVQKDDVIAAYTALLKNPYGRLHLVEDRHARREDDAAAFGRNLAQIREVRNLAGGNFPPVHPERSETVDAHEVKGRAHKAYAFLVAKFFEARVVGERKMDCTAHFKLAFGLACCFLLVFGFRSYSRYDEFGDGGLELHIVRTGALGLPDHAAGEVQGTVVVHAGLGNDYNGFAHGLKITS
jgi:hypothetical protein